MLKLFKEIFRSFSKNKVIIFGLSILVFFASAIFTLLFDISNSYKKQLYSYKTVSGLQDLTVDLELQASGTFPQDNEEEGGVFLKNEKVYKPLNAQTISKVLAFNKPFIKANIFFSSEINGDENTYIESDFLENLYNKNKTIEGVLVDTTDNTITFTNNNINIPLFIKIGDTFVSKEKNNILNSSINFKIAENEAVFLKDLAKINIKKNPDDSKSRTFLSNLGSLYINIVTHEASSKISTSIEWEKRKELKIIKGDTLAEILGFEKNPIDGFYYQKTEASSNLVFVNKVPNVLDFGSKIHGTFQIPNIIGNQNVKSYEFLVPSANRVVQLKSDQIIKRVSETVFIQENYKLNYETDEAKKLWSGTYLETIKNLLADPTKKDLINNFSFWKKNERIYKLKENQNFNQRLNPNTVISVALNRSDLDTQIYFEGKTDEATSIKKIANLNNVSNISNEVYNQLTDANIASERFQLINSGAIAISKKAVIDETKKVFGEENIGIRKTVTFETLDDQKNQTTFHFINSGDRNQKIDGVQQNVGKLYSEQFNPSTLFAINSSNSDFFKTEELPSSIAGKVADLILSNYYADPNYLIVDKLYEPLLSVNSAGNSFIKEDSKIVLVKTQGSKKSDGLLGVTIDNKALRVVNKKNNLWTYDTKKAYTSQSLGDYFSEHKLTLSSQTINGAWARPSSTNPNSIVLPMQFIVPNTTIINEILHSGNLNLLQKTLEKVLRESGLFVGGFLNEQDIKIIAQSTIKSFKHNKLDSFIATGVGSNKAITRFGFDIIRFATEDFGPKTINNIFNKIINRIKTLLLAHSQNKDEQRAYLKIQIKNLLDNLTFTKIGNVINALPFGLKIEDIFDYVDNPIAFFDALNILVDAFDLKAYTAAVQRGFEKIDKLNKLPDNKDATYVFSTFDAILPLFENADANKLKSAFNLLIDNIDFRKLLAPDSKISIISLIIKQNPNANTESAKALFRKINSSADGSYKNVNEALKEIVSLFNLRSFVANVRQNLKAARQYNPTNNTTLIFNKISSQKLLSAFISSIFQRDDQSSANNDRQFKLSLIKLLNLSDEGVYNSSIGAYLPNTSSTTKLGISDIAIFGSLNTANISTEDRLKIISEKLKTNNLNSDDISFLGATFPNLKNFTQDNFNNIKKNIDAYLDLDDFYKYNPNNTKTNFADLTNLLLNTTSSNPIFNQIVAVLKESIKFEAINTETNKAVAGYGRAVLDIANFFILLKDKYGDDNRLFLREYKKIYSLFNQSPNGQYNYSFMNDLNSKTLYPQNANNLNLAKTINISRALADNNSFTKEFFKNRDALTFFNSLDQKTQILINENRRSFINTLGILAALQEYLPNSLILFDPSNTNKNNLVKILTNPENILNQNPLVFDILVRDALAVRKQQSLFLQLHLNPSILSSFLNLLLPQVVLWYTSDVSLGEGATEEIRHNRSNVAYLIFEKLPAFNELSDEEIEEFISLLIPNSELSSPVESDGQVEVSFDYAFFLEKGVSINNVVDDSPSFFGINFRNLLSNGLRHFTFLHSDNSVLSFADVGSYLVKVNDAYLLQNDKEIYTGKIPPEIDKFNRFLEDNKDAPWILNVGEASFIIVGSETTADYLYPVTDEKNLHVNTKQQALLYVNEKGFSRALDITSDITKSYLLVHYNGKDIDTKKLQIQTFIDDKLGSSNRIQKVFLAKEIDPLNPERSLRISAPLATINTIDSFNAYALAILIVLVAITFIFVTKRYIANKSVVLGILLAQGYRKSQIALSLTLFALVVSMIGGISGYIVGNGLQFFVLNLLSQFWSLPAEIIKFNFVSLLITVFLPFIGMSVLVYVVTLIILRNSALELMSGITHLSINRFSKRFYEIFKKTTIKTKYSVSLFLSSLWKLMWLMLSFALTSFVIMFAVSSRNVFENAIRSTYENRKYNFKTDFVSPTQEGGAIQTFSVGDVNNNLYTPSGNGAEANLDTASYFAPGHSRSINGSKNDNLNGNPDLYDPHIFSSFSSNITISVGGFRINAFESVYNVLPDTLKRQVTKDIENTGPLLEKTQYDEASDYQFIRPNDLSNTVLVRKGETTKNYTPVNYFKYFNSLQGQKGFFYYRFSNTEKIYIPEPISTEKSLDNEINVRDQYRKFLVKGYQKIYQNNNKLHPFFFSFGGISYDPQFDEGYTYIDVSDPEEQSKKWRIYGYQNNSQFVKIVDQKGTNLFNKLTNFDTSKGVYPLVINLVSASKYKLKIADRITYNINNSTQRFLNQIRAKNNPEQVTFEIVGINPTSINDEFITLQSYANEITGLETLATKDNFHFNGFFTSRDEPSRFSQSIAFYAPNGYYSGTSSYDLGASKIKETYNQFFGAEGLLRSPLKNANLSEEEIIKFLDNPAINDLDTVTNENLMREAIQKIIDIYGNTIYKTVAQSINSLEIEAGFINNISKTVNNVLNYVLIISILISVIILIIISSIMVNENERNIALFSILGYNTRERIKLFFTVFVPFIALATLLSSIFVVIAIVIFNRVFISSASIALSLNLEWWHIILTMLACFAIFVITSALSWISISKIKPIILMSRKT